jgi:type IV pilus assembly protein PilQ
MTTHTTRLAGLALAGALLAGPALAAENAIRAIDVAERDGALEVAIQGTRPPVYTVFKLQDPPRLVVDLAGADVSAVSAPVAVGRAGLKEVSTAQYEDARSAVGRVVLALEGPRRYEVVPRGEAVVVRLLPDGAAPSAAPAPAPAPAVARAEPAPAPAEPSLPAAAPPEDKVVARRTDAATPASPASALLGVRAERGAIVLATDGEVGSFEVIELRDPARLAVDLHGVLRAPRAPVKVAGGFTQARFGRDAGKVRVVLDAAAGLPSYEVKRVKRGLAVVLAAPLAPAATATAGRSREAVAPAPGPAPAPRRARIQDVRFSQSSGSARIEVVGKAAHALSRPDARTVVLSLEGAELARKLERSLDTSAFDGPVVMVSSFNQPGTGRVKIVASLRGDAEDVLAETATGLAWTFRSARAAGPATAAAGERVVIRADGDAPPAAAQDAAAGFSAEAPAYAASGAPQARGYTGRRISLDFHDIEIRNLLRLIADVSKKNIVVADDVDGKVTVSLRNVPWDQALDLVLKSKGLGKEEMGNVIRVAKYEVIAKEQQARAEAEKARQPLVPLKVRLIPVNFADADEMKERVQSVLTDRGSVVVDNRTNVLIVKDVAEALVRVEGLIRNLDTEVPQVLIESRIVEASSNFNRAFGVQWGGNLAFTQATGNPTGLVFPNNVGVGGGAGAGASAGTAPNPNYAVSLPAPVGDGQGGAIGLILGSAGGAFNLNLRLSALENNGVVKTISAPRIATIDNKEATIGQGISIPFSQVSASGVNTTFIEAKLELKVTPHVSQDGSILLKIKATNNQPNPQLTGANGQPSISKREAETEVLLKDGETTVIGGIYTRQTSNRSNAVPFLSKIPVLGFFFKGTSENDDHTELLIFITPRILNRQATATNGATAGAAH